MFISRADSGYLDLGGLVVPSTARIVLPEFHDPLRLRLPETD